MESFSNPETITSRENAKVKALCKLAQSAALREETKTFFAEGIKLCRELAQGCELKELYCTRSALDKTPELARLGTPATQHFCISEPVADKLAGVQTHQGVFAAFAMPHVDPQKLLAPGKRLLALENVQDPGNVGTLLRSAAAFGFDGVLLSEGCAAPLSPKTVRASMGAVGRIPFLVVEDLPATLRELGQKGVCCLAAALQNSEPLNRAERRYPGGLCLAVGSEGQGLSQAAVCACQRAVRIPMTDKVESLNAGVAGSVLLWHFREEI